MFTHFGLPYVGQLCSRFILKSSKPPLHAPTSIFLCLSQLIDITPIAMVPSKRQKHSDSNEKTSKASGWIMPKPRCPVKSLLLQLMIFANAIDSHIVMYRDPEEQSISHLRESGGRHFWEVFLLQQRKNAVMLHWPGLQYIIRIP